MSASQSGDSDIPDAESDVASTVVPCAAGPKRFPPRDYPPVEDLNSAHGRVIVKLLLHTSSLFFVVFGSLLTIEIRFTIPQYWSLYCTIFLLVWWEVYFFGTKHKLWTLRRFLRDKSKMRQTIILESSSGEKQEKWLDVWGQMKDKSDSTSGTLGVLIAVITLFLGLVLGHEAESHYERGMQFLVISTSIVSIFCMIFAIDILDTVSNLFHDAKSVGGRTGLDYSHYYYTEIGPGFMRGGISYAYYGLASFSVFVVLSLSYFHTAFAGIGLAVYTFLGYPFWFGYRGKSYGSENNARLEIDAVAWVSVSAAVFFLVGTLAFELYALFQRQG